MKWGGHIEAVREGDLRQSDLYLLPYNQIKSRIYENNDDDRGDFVKIWNDGLEQAESDFTRARRAIWRRIFEVIGQSAGDDSLVALRGAHPGFALELYVDNVPTKEQAQELLVRMKEVYRSAEINSEGLRKIVKKYDKNRKHQLSGILLPNLYASSLYTGQKMIEDSCGLLRDLLDENVVQADADINGQLFKPLVKNNSEFRHQESVEIRMKEVEWLKSLVSSIPQDDLLPHLVAHRGFHHIQDRNDKRPLENSLSAYEMAWTCGIQLCECDIAITKDEKLILAHDENFERLSLEKKANSKRKVSDLTFRELISMPLSSGVRPPLLIDVLRSASAISAQSKLIIEIKPGNDTAAAALARLLIRHPDLCANVAMIMSFDGATMHKLCGELTRGLGLPVTESKQTLTPGLSMSSIDRHRRVTSFDHFGTFGLTGGRQHYPPSMEFGSIGLSISQSNLNASQNVLNDDQNVITPPPEVETTQQHSKPLMPKLMLLTVADKPKIPCELQVQYDELHRVDNWLTTADGSLDGVYLQYQEGMMTAEGAACLDELSRRYLVGIWGYSGKDPDTFESFSWLVQKGNCTFVNTDLPKHFRRNKQRIPKS